MSNTMSDNGLVSPRLVSGTLPRFPSLNTSLPDLKERLGATKSAEARMNSIVAQRKLSQASNNTVSPGAGRVHNVGEDVLVYSENKRDWNRNFKVVQVDGRMVTVKIQDGTYKSFNNYPAKPFYIKTFLKLSMFLSPTEI